MTSIANAHVTQRWTDAIQTQPWGVQQAIKTSLELTASGDVKMCWGTDYNLAENAPCLINSINMMLSADANKNPVDDYPEVVETFDSLNQHLHSKGVNNDRMVDPLAAEIMLKHMGTLKDQPENAPIMPSADDLAAWLSDPENLRASEPAQEIVDELMQSD